MAALSNSKNRPKFAVLRARHEAATSREAVGVTLDVCRRDLAKMGIFDKKKWKWWWYAGYMEICWFYGVSSVYDIWRYMEIYGDMCYNSIYQPSNMFFFMLEHHLCLQNGDVQWPVDPSGFETSWSVTTERFYGPQWLDWNLQYNQEYGDCQWYIYIYIIL